MLSYLEEIFELTIVIASFCVLVGSNTSFVLRYLRSRCLINTFIYISQLLALPYPAKVVKTAQLRLPRSVRLLNCFPGEVVCTSLRCTLLLTDPRESRDEKVGRIKFMIISEKFEFYYKS